jgi:hypothetical protein
MDVHVDVQINYWKEEVEIRAESLKIEIDEIDEIDIIDKKKNSFIAKLDEIRQDFKYLNFSI